MRGSVASLLAAFNAMTDHDGRLKAGAVYRALLGRLPSGAGFGVPLSVSWGRPFAPGAAAPLIVVTEYHRMNDAGFYVGWVRYALKVTPSWGGGIDVTIRGPAADGLREYVAEVYHAALCEPAEAVFAMGEGWRLLPLPADG